MAKAKSQLDIKQIILKEGREMTQAKVILTPQNMFQAVQAAA